MREGPLTLTSEDMDTIVQGLLNRQTTLVTDDPEFAQVERLVAAIDPVAYRTPDKVQDGDFVLLTPEERDLVRRLLEYATQGPIFDRVASPLDLTVSELYRLQEIGGPGPSEEGTEQ